jgi:hypothetical protein
MEPRSCISDPRSLRMDFLGNFAFRTAFPFGYLISFIGLLSVSAAGLGMLVRGLGTRPVDRVPAIGGGAMVAMSPSSSRRTWSTARHLI